MDCSDRYSTPDETGRTCVTQDCSLYERVIEPSACEDCPTGSFPDTGTGRTCVAKNCSPLEYLTDSGNCDSCMASDAFVMTPVGCYKDPVGWEVKDGQCRRASDGGYSADDYDIMGTAETKAECYEMCKASETECTAFELHSTGNCLIWYGDIAEGGVTYLDYECNILYPLTFDSTSSYRTTLEACRAAASRNEN